MAMNQQVIELCQTMLKNIDGCITKDHIAQTVDEILTLPTFKTAVDREAVIKKLEEKFTVWTEESQVLSNNDNHTPWLPGRRADITWSFWNRYKLSLENELPPAAVDSISEVTDKVLERLGYVTLVSCKLETGRTHQIRVHMKHIGYTLFNDARYGGERILKGTTFTKYKQFVDNCFKVLPRQALHAKTLGFVHPKTGEFMRFNTEIPDDMQQCIEKWKTYSKHQDI